MAKKTFDPNLWSLEKLLDSIYIVPVYQRPYSWEDEQINTLLNDVFTSYKNDSAKEGYYSLQKIMRWITCLFFKS